MSAGQGHSNYFLPPLAARTEDPEGFQIGVQENSSIALELQIVVKNGGASRHLPDEPEIRQVYGLILFVLEDGERIGTEDVVPSYIERDRKLRFG